MAAREHRGCRETPRVRIGGDLLGHKQTRLVTLYPWLARTHRIRQAPVDSCAEQGKWPPDRSSVATLFPDPQSPLRRESWPHALPMRSSQQLIDCLPVSPPYSRLPAFLRATSSCVALRLILLLFIRQGPPSMSTAVAVTVTRHLHCLMPGASTILPRRPVSPVKP